eukprot:228906_1
MVDVECHWRDCYLSTFHLDSVTNKATLTASNTDGLRQTIIYAANANGMDINCDSYGGCRNMDIIEPNYQKPYALSLRCSDNEYACDSVDITVPDKYTFTENYMELICTQNNTPTACNIGWMCTNVGNSIQTTTTYNNTDTKFECSNSQCCPWTDDNYMTKPPSESPTQSPTDNTVSPSKAPTSSPTTQPSQIPTRQPISPTFNPTQSTISPTSSPTQYPSPAPTFNPTLPTFNPTKSPTNFPTKTPTKLPTQNPTYNPSIDPTKLPTVDPTFSPTLTPTLSPTLTPTNVPILNPSTSPTLSPTLTPTNAPILNPTTSPTFSPTLAPTSIPTIAPSDAPTFDPQTLAQIQHKKELNSLERTYQTVLSLFGCMFGIIAISSFLDAKFIRSNDYFKISQVTGIALQALDMLSDCFFSVSLNVQYEMNSLYGLPLLLSISFIIIPA